MCDMYIYLFILIYVYIFNFIFIYIYRERGGERACADVSERESVTARKRDRRV